MQEAFMELRLMVWPQADGCSLESGRKDVKVSSRELGIGRKRC